MENGYLNTVVMKHWTTEEIRVFYEIVMDYKQKQVNELSMTLEEFMKISSYELESTKFCIEKFRTLAVKFNALSYVGNEENKLIVLSAFKDFSYDDMEGIKIKLSENFGDIIHYIFQEWDFKFDELVEFVQIKSYYARKVYIHIKKKSDHGYLLIRKDDFLKLFFIPESLKIQTNFNSRVLNPMRQELTEIFPEFDITPYRMKGKGRPIRGYEISW